MRRTPWIVVGSVITVVALAFGTLQVIGALASSTERRTTAHEGVRRISIDNDSGSITLRRSPSPTVTVRTKITKGLAAPRHREEMEGDRLVLRAWCVEPISFVCSVSFDVDVPAGVDVDARAVGGGLRAEGVDANLRLRSSGGGVRVDGGAGRLDLDSSGGGVRVEGAAAADVRARSSGGDVRVGLTVEAVNVDVSSSGGGVTVEMPDTPAAYRVDARSSGGGTSIDVRTDPSSDRRITARSSGGGVTVRYYDGVRATQASVAGF